MKGDIRSYWPYSPSTEEERKKSDRTSEQLTSRRTNGTTSEQREVWFWSSKFQHAPVLQHPVVQITYGLSCCAQPSEPHHEELLLGRSCAQNPRPHDDML